MLSFQKTKDENKEQAAAFKVTLGVMPDYSYSGNGMRVDAVLDDRPAKKAGLLGGDVIVKVGDMDIKDIYAYMKALSNYKKGDKTKVTVDRKGEQLTYEVEF
jgi:S1-C subfamily serine protease